MSRRFGSTPSDGALSMDEEVGFRENLDPEQLVRLQINRCNIMLTGGDEVMFANAVKSLLAIIPSGKRGEIEAIKRSYLKNQPELKKRIEEAVEEERDKLEAELERLEEGSYIRKVPRLRYEYYCGVRLGTEERPMLNDDGTPRSPVLEEFEETDYYRLFTIIQDKLEEANLSWKQELGNEEGGKIDVKKKDPPPTPIDKSGKPLKVEPPPPEEDEENDAADTPDTTE